jgi:short-subunit dehydrogenase
MKVLKDKNAIVTGSSYGCGRYIAQALAREGVNLALAARSATRLERLAAKLTGMGVHATAVPTDVTDPADREALVTQAEATLGPIDILVNGAGVHAGGRLHKRSPEQIQAVIETNLTASMLLTRRLLPGMLRRRRGHVVHLSSLAGKTGLPYLSSYVASKYGLVGFNHCLQTELHGSGVYSSAVCPGFVSQEGMWARLNRKVHPAFGLSAPERVATAVVETIRHNKVEVIVNPLPVRPVILLWALAPGLATRLFRWLRIDHSLQEAALQLERDEAPETAVSASSRGTK